MKNIVIKKKKKKKKKKKSNKYLFIINVIFNMSYYSMINIYNKNILEIKYNKLY